MRHVRKQQKSLMPKILLIVVLVAALSISSVVTVMANTADITVYDGSETYRFSMIGQNPQDILSRAQTEGMAPVSDIDTYDFSPENGTLTVQRFVRVSVKEDNASQMILAPKGKTLSDVFAENEITLGARDTADADLTAALTADIAVQITRAKRVFVSADGKRRMEDLNEGTVEDALKAAGITLGENDTVTPAMDTALTNGMRIRVQRYLDLTVTADGKTTEKSVAAENYSDAVEAMGITLGENDTVTPAMDTALTNGMRIRVQRYLDLTVTADGKTTEKSVAAENYSDAVEAMGITLGENDRILVATAEGEKQVKAEDNVSSGDVIRVVRIRTEEVIENEAVAYSTVYEDTEELYEGETETKTEGVEGEAKVTYTVTYADGEEESRVAKTKEVLKEAKSAVVLRGTKEKQNVFTDASGAPSSFEYSLTGSCTAYYAPAGAVTSIGATPQVGYVAVDPNRIPYGSLLYITAVDGSWTYGYCYAMDTGGAAMCGDIVADLYYDTLEDCTAFGRRDMIVYVVRAGW